MAENLGHVLYEDMPLTSETRAAARDLRRFGVKTGSRAFYLPRMIKPAASTLAAMLWAVKAGLPQLPAPPGPGLTSFAVTDGDGPTQFLEAACFMVIAGRAIRMDIVDRIDKVLLTASQARSDAADSLNTVVSLLGSSVDSAIAVARGLGWTQGPADSSGSAATIWRPVRIRKRRPRQMPRRDSPFAGLATFGTTE
jgi:ATP-dependent RNA helicase SUPV3L1/SUV3